MNRYTAQQLFSFNKLQKSRIVIPDNGTSLTVEVYSGVDWRELPESPITEPKLLSVKDARVRITPDTGGFNIDDGLSI